VLLLLLLLSARPVMRCCCCCCCCCCLLQALPGRTLLMPHYTAKGMPVLSSLQV